MSRKLLVSYMLALFFSGMAYLSIMPVNEGFDEIAHYSSLRQIADTATIPIYGKARLDQAITHYNGPHAYSTLRPPFDQGMSYAKFFSDPALAQAYVQSERQESNVVFQPDADEKALNWQAQHPPLYYVLLAPLTRLTDGLPLVTQVFLLRIASYILALIGVAFGIRAVSRHEASIGPAVIGFLFYPLLLPMFFAEFTRIGNDSLCLFLAGAVALLLSTWLDKSQDKNRLLGVGIVLGLGLLTKAFFLPISAGVGLFMLCRLWAARRDAPERLLRFLDLFWVFGPALLIGSGWYIYKFIAFGDITGSSDAIHVAQQGGLLINLERNFSTLALARSFLVLVVSWVWAGTWSLTRLPEYVLLPVVALAVWVALVSLTQIRRKSIADIAWLPVWTFGLFAGSLFYYGILTIALDGNGGAPGWYLHILMPWMAPALGLGIYQITQQRYGRRVFKSLVFYAVIFQIVTYWSQLALFTGCAVKGDNKHYAFPNDTFCLDQIPTIRANLKVIGWPVMMTLSLIGTVLCVIWLFRLSRKQVAIGFDRTGLS